MVSTSKVQQDYDNCLAETTNFLNKKGFEVTKNNRIRPVMQNQQLVVRLAEPLYFRNWPYRSGSRPNEKIDILAEITETIGLDDGKCLRSTLRLNYFRQVGERRVACEAIHYDFDSTVQSRHPVCHAQISNSIMEQLPESFPERDSIDEKLLKQRHQAIRIPTAFVNFAGLFAKLTADHLPEETVSDFWDTCKTCIDKIPTHAENEVFSEIFAVGSLRSYTWYKW